MKHVPEIFGFRNENAKRFPEMVVVGMSFVCNARCIHCPNAATNFEATLTGSQRLMSWGVLKEIARQCSDQSTLMRISSFGEILMHPEAVEMICHILDTKKDKNVALTTNGSLLSAGKAEILMAKGLRSIEFSVDAGSKQTYEKIRIGLNWENTLKNIETCIDIRNQKGFETKIMVSVFEQPYNEKELEQLVEFWQSRVDKVLTRKLLSFKGIIKRQKHYEQYVRDDTPCPFLWERVVVDPLGNVRGCVSDVNAEFVIGNIMDANLGKIWHSELMEEYRQKHLAGQIKNCPLCKDCVDREYRSWTYNYFHALQEIQSQ